MLLLLQQCKSELVDAEMSGGSRGRSGGGGGRRQASSETAKPVQKRKPVFESVGSLQPGQSTGHNLIVKVDWHSH